jgi:predicted acetyltransferase
VTDAALYPDLSFATLDVGKDGDPTDERVAGWNQAVTRGFHQGRASAELAAVWLEHARTDAVTLRGAWVNEPRVGPGTIPVATYSSFDKTLNAGLEPLPARMITDVTVAPSHRRRGLLRRMITDDLEDAVRHGVPVAVLTVSEGSIYGRFGFGAATHLRTIEVETTSKFALRAPLGEEPDAGRVEMVEPEDAWPVVTDVFDRFHRSTRGSVERPHFYRSILTGTFSLEQGGPDHQLRACVHVDGSDRPDGYVLYRHAGRSETPRTIDVVDLVAQSPTAYRQLWRFLADIDLVQRVRWHRAPTTDPLEWALVEPHVVKVTGVGDLLWVRVLDVPVALRARPWSADGSVVLEVEDPLGHAGGRWLVRTEDGRAEVTATDAAADVRLAADTLGSLYLGGAPVSALRDGGRLAGAAEAVATLAAMADGGPVPYCITAF